jgi:hypothetical protein
MLPWRDLGAAVDQMPPSRPPTQERGPRRRLFYCAPTQKP